ncbi:NPC intracellular cholesterol transporter 2 homolog a-like [Neodiprion virginianus]|uniref:NPC intracellular cholesterol transporter 2 homolog a-like n=1 Tax=Neodiprion virginianus TaxID=2961670 RepID=UPI001EE76339|nr:NPC intracellular cholesterol transporter 2 homolog a-like [Neodiprion virginianus]
MMREIFALSLVLVLASESAFATTVLKCGTNDPFPDSNTVKIANCGEPPCFLKKGTIVSVELKFKPTRNVNTLTTKATGALNGGFPQPFESVDGSNACDYIFDVSGSKVDCPLTKDTEYIYKRRFPISRKYPVTNVNVHWALVENNEDIACFEVPAQIKK